MTFKAFPTQEALQQIPSQTILADVLQIVATVMLALNGNASTTTIIIVIVVVAYIWVGVGAVIKASYLLLLLAQISHPLRIVLGMPMHIVVAAEAVPCRVIVAIVHACFRSR